MGAFEQYKWDIDRFPVITFTKMCAEIDARRKNEQGLQAQIEELKCRNETQAQIIRECEGTHLSKELLDEMDRNSRAFGWEIGRGAILVGGTVCTHDDNPFLSKDWKKEMGFE